MKSIERHKLKENEFARTVTHAREVVEQRKSDIGLIVTVVTILLAVVGGYLWWQQRRDSTAAASFASAMVIHEAPVVPIPEPAPGSPAPVQQPGTYPTERAKLEAAFPAQAHRRGSTAGSPAGCAHEAASQPGRAGQSMPSRTRVGNA